MPSENSESDDSEKRLPQKTVGFIVNPIAGMGGAVGLKGTDGKEILSKAVSLGARPVAPARAESFLSEFSHYCRDARLVVGAGSMGEEEAKACSLSHTVLGGKKMKLIAKIPQELQS